MNLLARQQEALLAALLEWPAEPAQAALLPHVCDPGGMGLAVYRANGHALAQRALRQAYPVVLCMLGEESFADLARALWHAAPPAQGDVGLWGADLPDFVGSDPQLQEFTYLRDVARVEWALHLCARAADVAYIPETLQRLSAEDPHGLTLLLAPGLQLLPSSWPVVSLIGAHREGVPSLDQAAKALHKKQAQEALVWRAGFTPRLRQTQPGELAFLRALQQGSPLTAALDDATALDFAGWLPMAVETGLVLGVTDAPLQN
jgi:Putative DNA-binding domain